MKTLLSVLLLLSLALVPLVAGYYITLPKHGSCGSFQESAYYMDTEDNQNANNWVGTVPDGKYSYDIQQKFCSGNVDAVPSGGYCFLLNSRYPTTGCPPGFTNGSRTEEEENFLNFSFFTGPGEARPKVTYNPWWRKERPTWHFCCGTGNPATPISFDNIATQMPPKFMLYQKGGSCQLINGRNITSGYVHFDDEDYSNSNSFTGTLPDGVFDKNTRYQFCAYDVATLPDPVPSVELSTQTSTSAMVSWAPVPEATIYRLHLLQGTTVVQSVPGVTAASYEFTSLNPAVQYSLKVYSGAVVSGLESYEMTGKLLQFTTCAAGSTGIPCTAFCSPDCVHGNCSTTSTCNCEPGWAGAACDACSAEYYPQADDCVPCSTCSGHGVCSDGVNGTGLCSCSTGYTGASCSECQSEFFSSGPDCLPCDPTCLTCSDAITCLSCKTDILQFGACVSSCANGTYLEEDSCADCDPSCLTCFGGNSSQCLSCSPSLVRSGSSCLQTCPDGTYADSFSVCTPCPLNCATCSNATQCGSCHAPYLLQGASCITPAVCTASGGFESTGACAPCDGSCTTCSGSGPAACTSCPANTFWMEGQCLSACPVGQFGDEATQACLPCVSPCVSCTSSTLCEACAPTFFLYESGCLASCPSHTFPNTSDSSCTDCDSPCQTCADSASFCTSCALGSQSIDDGACVDECPTGKFSDSLMQCQPCYSTCASCTSASQGDCLTCLPSTYEEGTGFCVTACSPDRAPDANRVCQPVFCPETTTPAGVYYPSTQITHIGPGSCPAGSVGQISSECVLIEGVGVWAAEVGSCDPCPAGYYQDQAGQLMCKSCPANSNSPAGADSSTDCECLPGYRWEAAACIAITCPPITLQNASFPQALGGTAVLGTCVQGYLGNPTMQCLGTGSWNLVVQSPCILDTTPACRNPASCLSTSTALCNACYRSGGFVDPHNPTTCTCPATRAVYLPSSGYTCSPAIALCNGTYVCAGACLTCAGPASSQCYTCSNSSMVLVPSGNNPFGQCALPCLANQYRNSNGVCVSFDCSSLSNCNNLGSCYWNGQQPACQCNTGFGGSTCSIPSSCPALANCTGHGTCTLNGATGSVYCVCSLGWTGANCSNQTVFSFSPTFDTELGGKLITIVSSAGFNPTDTIVCTWKKTHQTGRPTHVVGYATSAAAFCVVPPNFYFFGYTTFNITINGANRYLGQFEFRTSNLLPNGPVALARFKYVTGQPKPYNYSTTPVFTQGDSTVSVKLYRWDWDPFNFYEYYEPQDPILVDLGVIHSGPNVGAINITLTLENNGFNWTRALHVVSVSSGKHTNRFYAFPFPGTGDTYAARCTEWTQNVDTAVPEFTPCPIHINGLIHFDHCLVYTYTPQTVFGSFCYSHRFHEDNCYYDFSSYYQKFHLWEPYKPTDFQSWLPQYFATSQLPKVFCCPTHAADCPTYNNFRIPRTKKKRSTPVEHPYLLAMAYGDPHFVNLNGDHFTFNGLGEFVALERAGEFEVQLRTTKRATGNATYISAVAIRFEDSHLGVYVNQMTKDFALVYDDEFQTEALAVGSRSLVPGGKIVVRRVDAGLIILTENKYSLDVSMHEEALSVQFVISSGLSGFTGLLGSTFEFRDGTPLPANATSMDIHPMGLSWRATAETSLFIYPPDKSFADYNVADFAPAFPETLPEDPVFSMTARQICQAAGPGFEQDCYFDVLQSKSYGSATASLTMGQYQNKFDTAYNQPPEFHSVSSLSVVLGQVVVVSYSVSDPEGDPFSVFVTDTPGVLEVDDHRYTFTVSSEMFLASSLAALELTAIDDKEALSSHRIPVSVRRSTCDEGLAKVTAESNLDLAHRCPAASTVCSESCKTLVVSLASLPCFAELEPSISQLYNPAKELCGEGSPDNLSLSPEAIVGIAVGLVVALAAVAAAVAGYVIYKKKGAQPKKNNGFEMREDSTDFVVQSYSDPKY